MSNCPTDLESLLYSFSFTWNQLPRANSAVAKVGMSTVMTWLSRLADSSSRKNHSLFVS